MAARFATRLRVLRERKCLSLRQLAALSGLDWSGLHRLETGRTTPRLDTLEKLAGVFGVSLDVVSGRAPIGD